jgi:hypothetical protein
LTEARRQTQRVANRSENLARIAKQWSRRGDLVDQFGLYRWAYAAPLAGGSRRGDLVDQFGLYRWAYAAPLAGGSRRGDLVDQFGVVFQPSRVDPRAGRQTASCLNCAKRIISDSCPVGNFCEITVAEQICRARQKAGAPRGVGCRSGAGTQDG